MYRSVSSLFSLFLLLVPASIQSSGHVSTWKNKQLEIMGYCLQGTNSPSINLRKCDSLDTNQFWSYDKSQIIHDLTKKCISLKFTGSASEVRLQLTACDPANQDMLWHQNPAEKPIENEKFEKNYDKIVFSSYRNGVPHQHSCIQFSNIWSWFSSTPGIIDMEKCNQTSSLQQFKVYDFKDDNDIREKNHVIRNIEEERKQLKFKVEHLKRNLDSLEQQKKDHLGELENLRNNAASIEEQQNKQLEDLKQESEDMIASLKERHWKKFETLKKEYNKVTRQLNICLANARA